MTEDIYNKTTRIKLAPESKARIREEVVAFMAAHPREMRVVRAAPYSWQGMQDRFWGLASFVRVVPAVIILCLSVIAGIEYTAGDTVPGDTLYPVKRINERISGLLARSEIASAQVDARLLDVRLEEMEELVYTNELTPDMISQLVEDLSTSVDRTAGHIDALKKTTDDPRRTVASFTAEVLVTLQTHRIILSKLTASRSPNPVAPVLDALDAQSTRLAAMRNEAIGELIRMNGREVEIAASAAIESFAEDLRQLTEVLRSNPVGESDHEREAYLTRTLSSINEQVLDAQTKREKGLFGEAFVAFQQAWRTSKEANILLEAHEKFQIAFPAAGK